MTLRGTVVNGAIVPDGSPALPEGARVVFELADDDIWPADLAPPPPTETYEEHLAILRQSIADVKAGIPGIPLDEAMALIAAEFGLPPAERE